MCQSTFYDRPYVGRHGGLHLMTEWLVDKLLLNVNDSIHTNSDSRLILNVLTLL